MIPIKGYATFHPLKHCWIGSGFKAEWFSELFTDKKILDPLKRIADETEEDYQKLDEILKSVGVKTYRSFLDRGKFKSLHEIGRPPVNPRDHFAVIGEKLYACGSDPGYANVLKQIDRKNIEISLTYSEISTATICRVGKDLWWDTPTNTPGMDKTSETAMAISRWIIKKYKLMWENEGFRVHTSHRGYHSDSCFCVVKPGCIVSLHEIQDYKTEFPGWDVLYLPDQSWDKVSPFLEMKEKVGGRWWLKGEEHNDELIHFVNTWLKDWVGYVEETVFDVNMLSIDENTIICNNYNKEVFEHFKKHKVEPIIFNFRHRYFWDGGIHCITQDLYREGKMEDYFG
jgi:hypothetical protein